MLRINKITLKRFMRIEDASLDFSKDNIILVTGENGEGKSALLEAIAICMCEHKRGTSFKDYVKVGHRNAHIEMSVTVKGTGDILFDVFLNDKGGTPYERTITIGDKEYKNSECNGILQNLNLMFYSNIIFAMQQESDIIKLTPMQRIRFMQQVFNFNFEDKTKLIESEMETNKNIANLLQGKIDVLSEEKKFSYVKSELPCSEDDYNEYKRVISDLEVELQKIDEHNKKAKDVEIKKQGIEQTIKHKKAVIDEHNATIEKLKQQKSEIENSVDKNDYDALLNEDLDKIKEASNAIELLQNEYAQKVEQHRKLNNKIIELNAAKKHIEDNVKKIENGKCPICGKDFEQHDMESFTDEVNKIVNEISEIKLQMNDINLAKTEETMKNDEQALKLLENKMNSHKVAQANQKGQKDRLLTIDIQVADLKSKIVECERDIEANVRLNDQFILMETKDASDISSKINDLYHKATAYETAVKTNKMVDDEYAKFLNNEEVRKKELDENKTKLQNLTAKNKTYEESLYLLNDKLIPYIIIKKCKTISNVMNDLIHRCFPYIDTGISHKNKGVEIIFRPDNRQNIEKNSIMASGFQKELISVAFRLALCKLYGLSFSFFDEIDSQSSEENSEILYNYILSLNLFEQIFIISQRKSTIDFIYNNYDVSVYKAANNTYAKLK